MKKWQKLIAFALLISFAASISACNASKCNCPKFSIDKIEANTID